MKSLLITLLLTAITFNATAATIFIPHDPTVMRSEHKTMIKCLDAIQENNGGLPFNFEVDRATSVYGTIGGLRFGCKMVNSGSKGLYFSGFHWTKETNK